MFFQFLRSGRGRAGKGGENLFTRVNIELLANRLDFDAKIRSCSQLLISFGRWDLLPRTSQNSLHLNEIFGRARVISPFCDNWPPNGGTISPKRWQALIRLINFAEFSWTLSREVFVPVTVVPTNNGSLNRTPASDVHRWHFVTINWPAVMDLRSGEQRFGRFRHGRRTLHDLEIYASILINFIFLDVTFSF